MWKTHDLKNLLHKPWIFLYINQVDRWWPMCTVDAPRCIGNRNRLRQKDRGDWMRRLDRGSALRLAQVMSKWLATKYTAATGKWLQPWKLPSSIGSWFSDGHGNCSGSKSIWALSGMVQTGVVIDVQNCLGLSLVYSGIPREMWWLDSGDTLNRFITWFTWGCGFPSSNSPIAD